jgi:hypothetical protein
MDWTAIKLNWKRLIPLAKARWPECGDAIEKTSGDGTALNKCIANAIGITEQEARHQTQEWALRLASADDDVKEQAPPPRVHGRRTQAEPVAVVAPDEPPKAD